MRHYMLAPCVPWLYEMIPPSATASRPHGARRWLGCFLLFLALVIFLQILHLPQDLDYSAFAFGDPGANLNVAYLVRHGYRPGVDFGHPYGLLEVLVVDLWFRLAGPTPLAYALLIFLLQVLMVAVLAEFVVSARLRTIPILFLAIALPIFLWVNFFNASHAIETLCLLAAITAHLKGRYDLALAAAAAAVLARPSLGYVYGAFLLSVVLLKIIRGRKLKASVLLLPSVSTGCLILLLAWRFGYSALLRTAFPRTGMANYRMLDYGFFRRGMAFWWPSPFTIHHYLGVPGFWLLATGGVILLGPIALLRAGRADEPQQRKGEIVLAAAIVTFVWIFVAFSHQWIGGWILYLFFAVLAVSLLGDFFPRFGLALGLLILLALNAERHDVEASVTEWRATGTSTLFPHMFSSGDENQLLGQIFAVVRNHQTAVVQCSGAISLLHDGLGEPEGEFPLPGITMPQEASRMKSEVAAAEFVFIPMPPWYKSDTTIFYWPQYLDPNRHYRIVFQNARGLVLAGEPTRK